MPYPDDEMNEATQLANLVLQKRGYLVMRWVTGHEKSPEVGEIIWSPLRFGNRFDGSVPGPFAVKSETNIEDFQEHVEAAGFPGHAPVVKGARYFRVVAE